MRAGPKQWLQRGIPIAISAGSLAWLFDSIDTDAVLDAVTWRAALVLIPALLVYGFFSLVLESASILALVHPRPADFRLWTAARIKSASYLLGIINYALGAAALTVLLHKRAATGLGRAAGIVLLISALDMVVVLTFGSIGAVRAGDQSPTVQAALIAIGGLCAFGAMALLRAPGSLGALERIRSLAVFDALRTVSLPDLGRVGALRVTFSISFIALSWAAFFAFDVDIGIADLVFGMMVVAVVSALPISVAGLGTGQAVTLYVFRDAATPGELLALSLVLSAGMIALRVAMGLVFAREFTREVLEDAREAA